MEKFENFNIPKVGKDFNENGIEGVIVEVKGTNLEQEIPADAFGNALKNYQNGNVDEILLWSNNYKQYLVISRKDEKN